MKNITIDRKYKLYKSMNIGTLDTIKAIKKAEYKYNRCHRRYSNNFISIKYGTKTILYIQKYSRYTFTTHWIISSTLLRKYFYDDEETLFLIYLLCKKYDINI